MSSLRVCLQLAHSEYKCSAVGGSSPTPLPPQKMPSWRQPTQRRRPRQHLGKPAHARMPCRLVLILPPFATSQTPAPLQRVLAGSARPRALSLARSTQQRQTQPQTASLAFLLVQRPERMPSEWPAPAWIAPGLRKSAGRAGSSAKRPSLMGSRRYAGAAADLWPGRSQAVCPAYSTRRQCCL